MKKKTIGLRTLFPETEEGYRTALESRGMLWDDYVEAYGVLKKALPELGIGSEYRRLKMAAEQPIKKIQALERRIEVIRRSLGKEPVKSILE